MDRKAPGLLPGMIPQELIPLMGLPFQRKPAVQTLSPPLLTLFILPIRFSPAPMPRRRSSPPKRMLFLQRMILHLVHHQIGLNLEQKTIPFISIDSEVLTDRPSTPRCDMCTFTLASVGWKKAAILSPRNLSKAARASFLNGLMNPTEGTAVERCSGFLPLLKMGLRRH